MSNPIRLTAEQKQAMMLHINERLYEKGEITKAMYKMAKESILTINNQSKKCFVISKNELNSLLKRGND